MPICHFCLKFKNPVFCIHKIVLQTNKNRYEIGLQILLEKLGNWLIEKYYHLSASEIVLLRPDILLEFFKEYKSPEKIYNWIFKDCFVCEDCFKDYAKQVPLR